MAWRIALGVWGALGTVGLVLFATGGTIAAADAVNGVAGLAALVALWAVVKLPWDLYFAARHVQQNQAESVARSVSVEAAERQETARLARRLLAVAVALHVLGAGVCATASWVSGGHIGWFAAGAFLVTMLLRPAAAMVSHVRARLTELQGRALMPRHDAQELFVRLEALEHRLDGVISHVDDERRGLAALDTRTVELDDELKRSHRILEQRHRSELDRLGLEMERALEKLTRDQEVIAGLRAFLQMVRETRSV